MSAEPLPEPPPQLLEPPVISSTDTSDDVPPEPPCDPPPLDEDLTEPRKHYILKMRKRRRIPPIRTNKEDHPQKNDDNDGDYDHDADEEHELEESVDSTEDNNEESNPPPFDESDFANVDDERDDIYKCIKLASSEDAAARQQAARSLAQCLHDLGQGCLEQQMVMLWKVIEQLAHDSDPGVRLELIDHLSILSGICLNRKDNMPTMIIGNRLFPSPPSPLLVRLHRQCIIPALATLMRDQVLQVRKTSHCVLLRMLELRLIAPPAISRDIRPTVLELAEVSPDAANDSNGDLHDTRQEAATLLAKLIRFVDSDRRQTEFLPPFLKLCNDQSFHVRRACAVAMVELCQVLDAQTIQNCLLTTFLSLCEDDAWSVRKACTESFMTISCAVEPRLRLDALAPRFLYLLRDRAKWVSAAAYQNLGPFISTFADPKRTGLELIRPDGIAQEAAVRRTSDFEAPVYEGGLNGLSKEVDEISIDMNHQKKRWNFRFDHSSAAGDDSENNNIWQQNSDGSSDTDLNFNSFMYWRFPIPMVEELNDISEKLKDPLPLPAVDDSSSPKVEELNVVSLSQREAQCLRQSFTGSESANHPYYSEILSDDEKSLTEVGPDCGIPVLLLDHFKGMLRPTLARTIDCLDLARNCAYSLPAVALALGPQHWEKHLSDLVVSLGANNQWKVRHSVASSLHSLVIIMGDRDAVNYIIPLFNTFCRDVDEVRLPLLRNFHQICIHLEPESRQLLLDPLLEFTRSENERMWRLRDELARQICLVAEYYRFSDRFRYFLPILMKLLQDKVAQVRTSAASCFGSIVWGKDPIIISPSKTDDDADVDSASTRLKRPPGEVTSYFDALELVIRKLCIDGKWAKWQHRQAFARLLTSIVEKVPDDVDILDGTEEKRKQRALEGITEVCPQSAGLRNLAVVAKLIRPEVESLLEHRVPNIRLEAASLLGKMAHRCSEIAIGHKQTCESCDSKLSKALEPTYTRTSFLELYNQAIGLDTMVSESENGDLSQPASSETSENDQTTIPEKPIQNRIIPERKRAMAELGFDELSSAIDVLLEDKDEDVRDKAQAGLDESVVYLMNFYHCY